MPDICNAPCWGNNGIVVAGSAALFKCVFQALTASRKTFGASASAGLPRYPGGSAVGAPALAPTGGMTTCRYPIIVGSCPASMTAMICSF